MVLHTHSVTRTFPPESESKETREVQPNMSEWDFRAQYLYLVPAKIMCDFGAVMDSLSDSDWARFASHVLSDQTEVRLALKRERRTDGVMSTWGNRNGTVGDLLSVLEELKLHRARDIILSQLPKCPRPMDCSPPKPPLPHCPLDPDFSPLPVVNPLPNPGPPPSDLDSDQEKEVLTVPQSVVPPVPPSNAMCWSFEEVQQGTNNFSAARQVGEGGFGHVYRANMKNTEYAVKRLKEDSRLNWTFVKESFKTEVEKLSQYRHPNIVDFAGYCVGGGTHCLLYVFMPNGSLEDWLHRKNNAALSWPQRVNVLLGSAKAIQFLHNSNPQLIHGDIKSSNILLGEHMEAKLGDFGLARFCHSPHGKSIRTTTVAQTKTVRGTLAYLPDEYVKGGELGLWIDTYSFGVVLLEVLTGRRAMEVDSQSRTLYLRDLVMECEEEGEAATHIWKKHLDPQIAPADKPGPLEALDISSLACRCLDRRKKKRPPMAEVFERIQEISTVQEVATQRSPKPCIHSVPRHHSPPTAPPSASVDQSLASLTEQELKLEPQEDTYHCLPNQHSGLPQPKTLCSQGQTSGTTSESWGPRPPSFQVPCESDESQGYSQYSASAQASFCQSRAVQSPSLCQDCQLEAGSLLRSTQASAAQARSLTGNDSKRIVVNSVKQRFVQKMALYEEGKIPMSDLLSSDDGTCGQSRGPEESDEFESSYAEAGRPPENRPF
ncbi:interleukin-1 receptor-associated kinase 1 isoform X2 [Paramormyrops kingsleyae]|uniref:interleukin-1 receptor-associated kinase 1 isoform X2 n=1 Tax=Paramormyrops kingsleyae TaxID=1676925 RepID=UPI000CD6629C|nr:interleukin-1 receptor-associated kinase 1 isoform X2 [Paramormyrops kingsleyae]